MPHQRAAVIVKLLPLPCVELLSSVNIAEMPAIWDVHVACTEERRSAYRVVVLDLKEGEYLDVGVDVKIIFKWICKKCHEKGWTGLIWRRIPREGGHL